MRSRPLPRGGLTLAALLIGGTSRGGDAVDDYVADEMRQQRIPGLSLAPGRRTPEVPRTP